MNNIICYVDYYHAGIFFLHLASEDTSNAHSIVTTIPSIHKKAKQLNLHSILLRRHRAAKKEDKVPFESISCTREFKLNIMTRQKCEDYYSAILKATERVLSTTENNIIFCWNGATVMGEAARYLQRSHRAKNVFMEISNLPGKLFADPKGVNAQSQLFDNADSILGNLDYCREEYSLWREQYIETKKKNLVIPQAKLGRSLKKHHVIDLLYTFFWGFRTYSHSSIAAKVISLLRPAQRSKSPSSLTTKVELPKDFIFFPLQVSNDTQLLLNSELGNLEALEKLVSDTQLPIIIKPHPAETDLSYLTRWLDSQPNTRVQVRLDNTYDLINASKIVATINSTVGLESLIAGKQTIFLGKSFYKNLSTDTLAAYITRYLIDIDFFSFNKSQSHRVIMEKIVSMAK